jgi:hypothetical protein
MVESVKAPLEPRTFTELRGRNSNKRRTLNVQVKTKERRQSSEVRSQRTEDRNQQALKGHNFRISST